MAEFNSEEFVEKINRSVSIGLEGVATRLKAVFLELKIVDVQPTPGRVYFNTEGQVPIVTEPDNNYNLEGVYMTRQRWEDLGKPGTVNLLIGTGEPAPYEVKFLGEEPSPNYLDLIESIFVQPDCTVVYFENSSSVCSHPLLDGIDDELEDTPNLRNLEPIRVNHICTNPECPQAGRCHGECVRNF